MATGSHSGPIETSYNHFMTVHDVDNTKLMMNLLIMAKSIHEVGECLRSTSMLRNSIKYWRSSSVNIGLGFNFNPTQPGCGKCYVHFDVFRWL